MTYPDLSSFGHDPWWLVVAKALGIFVFLLLTVLVAILLERKILGRMQMRFGPNRVGPFGLLQSLADGGVKLALKEGLIPRRRGRQADLFGRPRHRGHPPPSWRSR